MKRRTKIMIVALFSLVFSILSLSHGFADSCSILAVMSYDDAFYWSVELKEGIEKNLNNRCTVRYLYLDTWRTKDNIRKGEEKAKEAYGEFLEMKPDIVLATDDNAQSMFVVPYLMGRHDTPVVFCGVNNDPGDYGYPNDHVTGVLEVCHFRESISFLRQLCPNVKTVGFIMRDRPTSRGFKLQYDREHETYAAKSVGFKLVKDLDEALRVVNEFKNTCDAMYIEHLEGLPDKDGNPMPDSEVIPILLKKFKKPTFCSNANTVKLGVLCAIVKMAEEQGALAAEIINKIVAGTPVSEIPVTKNHEGKGYLNISTMKSLGIKPAPAVLVGVELVRE